MKTVSSMVLFFDNNSFLSRYIISLLIPMLIPVLAAIIGYLDGKNLTSFPAIIITIIIVYLLVNN